MPGKGAVEFGAAHAPRRIRLQLALLVKMMEEGSNRRQLARYGSRCKPSARGLTKEGADCGAVYLGPAIVFAAEVSPYEVLEVTEIAAVARDRPLGEVSYHFEMVEKRNHL